MVKSGDTVSLSIHPSVQITRFLFVKASATVTRTIGANVREELEEMRADLEKLYFHAVGVEIGVVSELADVVDADNPLEALRDYVMKKVTHEKQQANGPSARRRKA